MDITLKLLINYIENDAPKHSLRMVVACSRLFGIDEKGYCEIDSTILKKELGLSAAKFASHNYTVALRGGLKLTSSVRDSENPKREAVGVTFKLIS